MATLGLRVFPIALQVTTDGSAKRTTITDRITCQLNAPSHFLNSKWRLQPTHFKR